MRIKHKSQLRQKMLSLFLVLSLLFNIFAPLTRVLADSPTTYTIDYTVQGYGGMVTPDVETHPLGYTGDNSGSTAIASPGYKFVYWSSDPEGQIIESVYPTFVPSEHKDAIYYAHFAQDAQKVIKVKPVDKQKVYDGAALYPTEYEIVEGGFDPWEDVQLDDAGIVYGGSKTDVGTQWSNISGGLYLVGYDANKYSLEFLPGELTVTQRIATVTAERASKRQSDADPNFTFTTSNFLPGDEPSPSDYVVTRPGAGTDEAVGSYANALVVTNTGGFQDNNYIVNLVSGDFDITQRPEYTVTYAPGTHGTFTEQVYTVPEDSATPAFAGYPDGQPGYTFVGWTPTIEDKVTRNITYTAEWQQDQYTVTYAPGTHGTFTSEAHSAIYGEITPAFNNGQTPTGQAGYTFAGWSPIVSDVVTASVTYIAQWNPSVYQITYELDGGTNSNNNPSTYTFGIGVTDFEPATKAGYIFQGWFDEKGQEVTAISDTETGDKTLYAHFQQDRARIEAQAIVRTIPKNTTYTWQHTEHHAVLYDETGDEVEGAELWAIIDGKVYRSDDLEELPEGVHHITFTNRNPNLKFSPYGQLFKALDREVRTETTATIIAAEAKPAPITVRYVDQSGKALKTSLVLTGKIGDRVTSAAPMIAGYELISLSHQVNTVVTAEAQTFTFVYKAADTGTLKQPDSPATGGTPLPATGAPLAVPGTPLPTTGTPLPRTGELQEAMQLMMGLFLVAVISLLSWLKLGQLFEKPRK